MVYLTAAQKRRPPVYLWLPKQPGQAEMSPTSIFIRIYPACDPVLFTMLQKPQITPIITHSPTARRSRYQKINMLMYQPGVQSVTAQLYSHATCLPGWRGRAWGLAHDTHTLLRRGILEGWSGYHRGSLDNFGLGGNAQRNIIKHQRMMYCACSNVFVTCNIHACLSYFFVGTSKREFDTWKKDKI